MFDRLWSKINKQSPDKCWEWTAWTNHKGYGKIKIQGKMKFSHRVVFEETFGPIHNGLYVMHICDNPKCCNPNHLKQGTLLENNQDRHRKGRTKANFLKGDKNIKAIISNDVALRIFNEAGSAKEVAAKLKVNAQLVSDIKIGKTWSWLTGKKYAPRKRQ